MEKETMERGDWVSSAHFEAILASAMDAIITIDADQNIVFFNGAAENMFGIKKDKAIGQPLLNLIPEAARAGHVRHVQLFRDTGVTGRKMGALGILNGLRSNGETFRIEAGISQATVGGKWLATVILRDITERLAVEEARQLLSQEVDHRAKNALAVVHAIVKLTSADSIEEYVEAITGRLDTLARAHSLLAKSSWTGGDLRAIIDEELVGFQRAGQVTFDGPPVTLAVKSVQPISLLFHELATNAFKHGALSVNEGTVAISWHVDRKGTLLLRWDEHGGPPVVPPEKEGFGSLLIGLLSEQLRSQGTSTWLPQGLSFTVELASSAFKLTPQQIESPADTFFATDKKPDRPKVLIVEDEAIVALLLSSGLKNDGWEIIGPASTLDAAYQLLADGAAPDAAVLDINLDGIPVYPLARVLQARAIPFLFLSGYSAPVLEASFKDTTLIGKPARSHVVCEELSRLLRESDLIASRT